MAEYRYQPAIAQPEDDPATFSQMEQGQKRPLPGTLSSTPVPAGFDGMIYAVIRRYFPHLLCVILILGALAGYLSAAPIYIWYDEQDQVHLSDRPPPEGVDYRLWSNRADETETETAEPGAAPTDEPGATTSRQIAPNAGLFWQIVHPNRRVSHLLGTIHSDDPRVMRLPQTVALAFRNCERFVMEVAVDQNLLLSMGTRMIMLDGSNLKSLLGENDFAKVAQAMAPYGVPTEVLQMMKPWAVMALISTPRLKSNQFLDLKLQRLATAQNKAVAGLETIDEQLAAFDELTMADQVELLKATIRQLPELSDYVERLIRAYLRDDLQAIARLSEEYQSGIGSRSVVDRFMRQLNDRRNDRMVRRMTPYLEAGNAFVAVGALHLTGGRGILAQLAAQGYAVIPVRK